MALDFRSRSMPETIGDYQVTDRIGQGGMGEVYRALDAHLDRPVAIKLIRSDLTADTNAQERFRREAQAIARLDHPSIVRIHHIQKWDGHHCIVMELVEGQSLDALLREAGPPSSGRALLLLHQVAEGLAAAHAQGIIHRDLKTTNVMATPGGGIKILDFGLAKRLSGDTVSAPGAVVGTLHTMSPEQAQGRPVDTRTDLFSLGALAYELLTGTAPFRGENASETYARVIGHRPPPVHEISPDIPEDISRLVDRLLEKDPDERPSSSREVAEALARWIDTVQPTAPEPPGDSQHTTLAGGVRRADRAVASDALAHIPTATPNHDERVSSGGVLRMPRARLFASMMAGLLVVAGLFYSFGPWSSVATPATVLILGFAAEDGGAEDNWMSTALAEQLTEELRGHREIRVLGGEEASQLRRHHGIDDEDIRQEPEEVLARVSPRLADLVVVGTWKGTYDHLEVEATLRNTRAGHVVHERLGNAAASPLLVARGLAATLTRQLGIRPFAPEETGTFTSIWPTDPEGLRAYVEALAAWRNADLSEAEAKFERAIERVPTNALVQVEWALFLSDRLYQREAEEAATKAITLAESLDSNASHRVLASAHEVLFEPVEAARSYRRLFDEHPDEPLFGIRLAQNQELPAARITLGKIRSEVETGPIDVVSGGRIDLTEAGKLLDSGRTEEALSLARNAISIGRELEHSFLRAKGRQLEGIALDEMGNYPEALESLQQSQVLFEQMADYSNAITSFINRTIVLAKQGEDREALTLFTNFHKTFLDRGDEINAAILEVNRGSVLLGLDRLEDAEQALEKAIESFTRLGMKDQLADALASLAIAQQLSGDLERARTTNEQALEIYRELGLTRNTAVVLGNLGEVLQWSGDLAGAEARYEEALEIHQQGGNERNEHFILGRLGEIAILEDELDAAGEHLRSALELGKHLDGDRGNRELTAESQLGLARLELEAENLGDSQGHARTAMGHFLDADSKGSADRARLVLLRVLSLSKAPDWKEIDDLESLLDPTSSGDYRVRFGVPLVRAEIEARRDSSKLEASREAILDLAHQSEQAGRILDAWEARLLLGELETHLGAREAGRRRLEEVRDEAQKHGWVLFERRAAGHLDR